jgi:hypothetical protein
MRAGRMGQPGLRGCIDGNDPKPLFRARPATPFNREHKDKYLATAAVHPTTTCLPEARNETATQPPSGAPLSAAPSRQPVPDAAIQPPSEATAQAAPATRNAGTTTSVLTATGHGQAKAVAITAAVVAAAAVAVAGPAATLRGLRRTSSLAISPAVTAPQCQSHTSSGQPPPLPSTVAVANTNGPATAATQPRVAREAVHAGLNDDRAKALLPPDPAVMRAITNPVKPNVNCEAKHANNDVSPPSNELANGSALGDAGSAGGSGIKVAVRFVSTTVQSQPEADRPAVTSDDSLCVGGELPCDRYAESEAVGVVMSPREVGIDRLSIYTLAKIMSEVIITRYCSAPFPRSNCTPGYALSFQSKNIPSMSVGAYLTRIAKHTGVSGEAMLMGIAHIERIRIIRPEFPVNILMIHRLILISIMVSAKHHDDWFMNNARWAKVGGIPVQELNGLEILFLQLVNYSLFVSPEHYAVIYRYVVTARLNPAPAAPAASAASAASAVGSGASLTNTPSTAKPGAPAAPYAAGSGASLSNAPSTATANAVSGNALSPGGRVLSPGQAAAVAPPVASLPGQASSLAVAVELNHLAAATAGMAASTTGMSTARSSLAKLALAVLTKTEAGGSSGSTGSVLPERSATHTRADEPKPKPVASVGGEHVQDARPPQVPHTKADLTAAPETAPAVQPSPAAQTPPKAGRGAPLVAQTSAPPSQPVPAGTVGTAGTVGMMGTVCTMTPAQMPAAQKTAVTGVPSGFSVQSSARVNAHPLITVPLTPANRPDGSVAKEFGACKKQPSIAISSRIQSSSLVVTGSAASASYPGAYRMMRAMPPTAGVLPPRAAWTPAPVVMSYAAIAALRSTSKDGGKPLRASSRINAARRGVPSPPPGNRQASVCT